MYVTNVNSNRGYLIDCINSFCFQNELQHSLLKTTRDKILAEDNYCDRVSIRNNGLALYMDMGLTRSKYIMLRKFNSKNGIKTNKFPSYEGIFRAKNDCYPLNITVTENGAKVELQNMLDHTVFRIAQILSTEQKEV